MQTILDAIELLKAGISKKVSDNVFVLPNAIVYRMIQDNATTSIHGLTYIEEILAIKSKSGVILGNSSRLDKLENMYIRNEIKPNEIQNTMAQIISMVPFSVFRETGLDLLSCEVVDAGTEETLKEKIQEWHKEKAVKIDKIVDRHFTGARLFRASPKRGELVKRVNMPDLVVGSQVPDKYFLCDVDRREVEHNIINFFLAELPEKCDTIEQAYEMLKPNIVKDYELNEGVKVARQGEFFFIPSFIGDDISEKCSPIREIRVGNSRPNRVEKGFQYGDSFYVTGIISHTGREHADLELSKKQWFLVVPNTSKANFQLTGNID